MEGAINSGESIVLQLKATSVDTQVGQLILSGIEVDRQAIEMIMDFLHT
jgi:hypothetical protein